jgi:hypothetical protein
MLMESSAAVDLGFMGLENTRPEDAEVFCPIAAPRYVLDVLDVLDEGGGVGVG